MTTISRINIHEAVQPYAQQYIPNVNLQDIDFTPWVLKSSVGLEMFEKGFRIFKFSSKVQNIQLLEFQVM